MANFSSLTCFTPDEQIIKHCLKLLSINCRHCVASLTAASWLTHQQSCRRVCDTFHHLTSLSNSPIQSAVCNTSEAQCRLHIPCLWVHSLTQKIVILKTYLREISYEKCCRKFWILFPGVAVPSTSWELKGYLEHQTVTCRKLCMLCA